MNSALLSLYLKMFYRTAISGNTDDTSNNGGGGDNNGGNNGGDNGGDTTKSTLYFKAGVVYSPKTANFATTVDDSGAGSYENIAVGRFVNISAFNNGNPSIQAKGYESKTVGTLNPSNDTQMSLATGIYDLYAAGVNAPVGSPVPAFTFSGSGASSTDLSNGIDYIWAAANGKSISSSESTNIYFKMTHSCTQIILNITAQSGITLSEKPVVNITPSSTSGAAWNLVTGVIPPVTSISQTTVSMGVGNGTSSDATTANAFNAQLTMLPLAKIGTGMTCSFSVKVNNESSARNYSIVIPPYDGSADGGIGGYQAGYSYIYNMQLSLNTVTFNEENSVQVKDWQAVTVGGILVPSQQL